MERIHFVVRGRVQGVWFRASTAQAAERSEVSGWVRNRPDHSVEGEAQGSPEAVAEFRAFLGHGPRLARVDELEIEPREPVDDESAFRIR